MKYTVGDELMKICCEFRRCLGSFNVSTHLHATFIYYFLLKEGLGDYLFEPDEFYELFSYGLVVERDGFFYLNNDHPDNLKLLFILSKINKRESTMISDKDFWRDNLMLYILF